MSPLYKSCINPSTVFDHFVVSVSSDKTNSSTLVVVHLSGPSKGSFLTN